MKTRHQLTLRTALISVTLFCASLGLLISARPVGFLAESMELRLLLGLMGCAAFGASVGAPIGQLATGKVEGAIAGAGLASVLCLGCLTCTGPLLSYLTHP